MKLRKIEGDFSATEDGKCSVNRGGMVSSAFPEATDAGVEMLQNGGNAVDAACATAFALSVCEPQASGIGGQSLAILHFQGKTIALDGSSRVPSLAHIDSIDKKTQRFHGYKATTIPSTPAVLGYLHFRYGKLNWPEILRPAIRIAREGYHITKLQNNLQNRELEKFRAMDYSSGSDYFFKEGLVPYEVGEKFVQQDLENLLEYLAKYGVKGFYTGDVANEIDKDMRMHDGFLRKEDLALIPWPLERKPIRRTYRKVNIFTCPPPGSGRTLLLVMQMFKNLPSKFFKSPSPKMYHFMAEAFRKGLLNHKERPFDPNIYPQLPHDKKILSLEFARKLSSSIRDEIDPTLPLTELYTLNNDTTHLSVMDSYGNAIGITQSIELVYGARVAARGMGFLYNNYMSSLDTVDPSHPYYLRPNGIPWSSVAPVIAFYKNIPWLVAGSPGSERIFSSMSQFLSHVIDGDLPINEAMVKPRMHCTVGGKLTLEADRFDPNILTYLESVGYKIDAREPYSFYLGAIHAVLKSQNRNEFQGVAEIRRDGTAKGP